VNAVSPTAHGDDASTSERTLADVEREFGWSCWQDADQYYARHPQTPAGDHDARGDDPDDLREAILLALPRTIHQSR
jgi:hypothetical protein